MRSLLHMILFLMFSLCFALSAIVGATYRDTNRFAYLFTKPDGSKCETSCLLGIDPTTTTYAEAEKLILNKFGAKASKCRDCDPAMYIFETPALNISLGLDRKQKEGEDTPTKIQWVSVIFHEDSPEFHELMLLMRRPKRLRLAGFVAPSGMGMWRMLQLSVASGFYELVTDEDTSDLRPHQKLMTITIVDTKIGEQPDERFDPWLGFADNSYTFRLKNYKILNN
jgi:hypothetical protein